MNKVMALLILQEQQSQIDEELDYGICPEPKELEEIAAMNIGFVLENESKIARLSDADTEKLNDMYIEYLEGLLNET